MNEYRAETYYDQKKVYMFPYQNCSEIKKMKIKYQYWSKARLTFMGSRKVMCYWAQNLFEYAGSKKIDALLSSSLSTLKHKLLKFFR
jgi:hypothetical protein